MLLARQPYGSSHFSAECHVHTLGLQEAVTLMQLLLQKEVCCWLHVVVQ